MSEPASRLNAVAARTAVAADGAGVAGPADLVPGARTRARELNIWQRWAQRPHQIWARRALFQVHLWVGIGVGLYILMISITGSAVIYRREISRKYSRKPVVVAPSGTPLSSDALRQAAMRLYPGYTVADYFEATKPNEPVAIVLARKGGRTQHLFNPYTGEDLGDALSPMMRALLWTVDLHDNLLGGTTGRYVNGIGAILTTVLGLTGAIIWWPGKKNWRRGLTIKWGAKLPRFNYDLHSAVGVWFLFFVLMWGITGIYLSFPKPFYAVFNWLDPDDNYTDTFLQRFESLHFGRYGHIWEGVWVVLGLVPAVLVVTGAIMWWKRVLSKGERWPE